MGRLHRTDDTSLTLAERTLVGRAESCHLKLRDRRVSGQHALIYYDAGRWWLRDLGSRNGTYVDGRVVQPAEPRPLVPGSRLQFHASGAAPWLFSDDGPPRASAFRLGAAGSGVREEAVVVADAGFMLLPEVNAPEVQIHAHPQGWSAEWVVSGETFEPADGQTLSLEGTTWRLSLPPRGPGTSLPPPTESERSDFRPGLPFLHLRVRVSRDRESVQVVAKLGRREVRLAPRACHELLLLLAEARIADQAQPQLRPAEHGWVYADLLAEELGHGRGKLNVDVCRLRKQFARQLGISDAAGVIERRPRTQQLRVGIEHLVVEPM
ncbi:MAG: FHA domain-containing protein [Myxococcota bacterium]